MCGRRVPAPESVLVPCPHAVFRAGQITGVADQQAVLLIDLGGVLFEFDHQYRLQVLGSRLGLAPDKTDALLWRSGFSADCDAGRYPSAAAVRAEIRRAGPPIPAPMKTWTRPGAAPSAPTRTC